MTKFLKESFSNGNKFTNILLSLTFLLVGIIGFFLKDVYSDFKELSKQIHNHNTCIELLKQNYEYCNQAINELKKEIHNKD